MALTPVSRQRTGTMIIATRWFVPNSSSLMRIDMMMSLSRGHVIILCSPNYYETDTLVNYHACQFLNYHVNYLMSAPKTVATSLFFLCSAIFLWRLLLFLYSQ